jgi:protoporphyrinogen oxidase
LALAGNGYSGIGVPDCVRSGSEAAGKILAEMGMWSSA